MNVESDRRSDTGLGYAVLFGLLALAGALALLVAPHAVGPWGFALAVTAGLVLVVVIHLYGA